MVVSKSLAEDISFHLVKPRLDACNERKLEYRRAISKMVADMLPDEIKKIWYQRPELRHYIRTGSQVRINFTGQLFGRWIWIDEVPMLSFDFDPKEQDNRDWIIQEQLYLDAEEKAIRELRDELTATLAALKTEKRIKAVLPEALQYIPTKQESNLPVSVNALREKLNLAPLPTE